MRMFYSPKELEGAVVVNLAGEYLGTFGGLKITSAAHSSEDAVEIRVVRHRLVRYGEPDVEGIRAEIEARFSGTLRRKPADQVVREVLGLPRDVQLSKEHYVETAKRLGIVLPSRDSTSYVEETWRFYPVSKVACICGPLSMPWGQLTMIVVREKEPTVRPLPPADASAFRGGRPFPEIAKPVVDVANCELLGLAVGIVIGSGSVGLRIERPAVMRRYINIDRLKADLAGTEFGPVVESLWRALGGEVDVSDMGKVETIVRSNARGRAANDLLRLIQETYIDVRTIVEGSVRDVPWPRVLSIGDVVILL